jgi:hypothetical protein
MGSASSRSDTIAAVDRDIAEAEGLIADYVRSLMVTLRRGADTTETERRVRDIRRGLELLYAQRRKAVRRAHSQTACSGMQFH